MFEITFSIPYSRKIWRGIKFGGLVVRAYNRQIKVRQYFLHAYIRMAIPYRTAKFKSANIFARADSMRSAKFNSRQIFRLYGTFLCKRINRPYYDNYGYKTTCTISGSILKKWDFVNAISAT